MKQILTVYILLFFSFKASSQLLNVKASYGVSDIIVTSSDRNIQIRPDFKNISPSSIFLLDIERANTISNIAYSFGFRFSHNVGGHHPIYGKWVGSFIGLKVGTFHTFQKLKVGVNFVPSLRIAKSLGISSIDGGISSGFRVLINYEFNPYLEYRILEDKISLVLDYAIGINNIYKIDVRNHRIHYSSIGIQYNF